MRDRFNISAFILGVFVTAFPAAADDGTGKDMTSDMQPGVVMDRLLSAIAARDLPATMACFTSGQDVAVVGSEQGEQALGRAAVESFFTRVYAKAGAYNFVLPTRTLTIHGDVAWMVADGGVTEPGDAPSKPYRLTAVFVRERIGYRVALWSGSEPVGH